MITDRVDSATVRNAIALASRAPSVHNSQPWRWYLGDHTIHLFADLRRWLPATDTDGRDLIVSCGAALHHLRIALAAVGVRTIVHRLPDPAQSDHLAAIELRSGDAPEADLGLAAAIAQRRSDRRQFGSWPVPEVFLQQLVDTAAGHGALLRVVESEWARARLMRAIREAAARQEEVPGHREELAAWSGRHVDEEDIPHGNLLRSGPGRAHAGGRFPGGGIETDPTVESDGAVLMVLATTSDNPLSQLRAGEALSAVLLLATDLGLATCPLSQPLDIGETRREVRDSILGGTLPPQLVLRVGWPPRGPAPCPTPRRPVADIVEPLDRHSG